MAIVHLNKRKSIKTPEALLGTIPKVIPIADDRFEEELLAKVSGERIKSLVARLSEREMRITGSESERLTGEAIAEELRKLDLDVSVEEYETTSWEHGPSRLTVTGTTERGFDVQFMPFSPPVPEKGAKGRLVPLRFSFPKEYSAAGDDSCIIIADWNQEAGVHFQILSAARSGKNIAALGMIGEASKGFRIDAVPMLAKSIPFPVFSITREDGLLLRSLSAHEGLTARLEGKSKIIKGARSANILGRKGGAGEPGLKIVVSAHHDGWFAGANDNLSGVACMLETARVLCDQGTRRSLEFISFGSEESGATGFQYYLWGSRQYAKRHRKEMGRIACIFNCELAGLSNTEHLLVDCTPDLVSFFEVVFDDTRKRCTYPKKFEMGAAVPTSSQADQLNFSLEGVSSSLIYWSWFDEYHTSLDTADRLNADKLQLFSELALMSAVRMANSPTLPLSLTRYSRILRTGHTVVSSHLSIELGRVSTPGLEQLKRLVGRIMDVDQAIDALDSFSRAIGSFERKLISVDEAEQPRLNIQLLETCAILNRSLCRTGGILGEDSMFPGYLQYSEELRKIDDAVESLARVKGSDMPSEIRAELIPIVVPEVSAERFDVFDELAALKSKREALAAALLGEIGRITGALKGAEARLRSP